MTSIKAMVEDSDLVNALARLKGIPVRKVLHNAAKDFAQQAYVNTPVANEPKHRYYRVKTSAGVWQYIPDYEIYALHLSKRKRLARKIYKVPFKKGWSRAAWIGVFRSLGMPPKGSTSNLSSEVATQGYTVERGMSDAPEIEIADSIHFDRFGRNPGDTRRSDRIVQAGFNLAAQRIAKGVDQAMKKAWNRQ